MDLLPSFMTEQEPILDAPTPLWDIKGAIKVLRAESTDREDRILGAGFRLTLPESGPSPVRIDLNPDRLAVRYRSSVLRVDIAEVGRLGVEADHVLLTSADDTRAGSCLIYPDG